MTKKLFAMLLVLTMVVSLSACAKKEPVEPAKSEEPAVTTEAEKTETPAETEAPVAEVVKVGMVTDSGTIDDKSFNQGTWEGIQAYEAEKKTIQSQYLQPEGEAETDYINSITNLVETGTTIVVTPGFKFESAIFAAQDKFPDTKFILIDGTPHSADYAEFRAEKNVVSVFFNEHESGFLAGVAAALSSKSGKLGFIGGMEIPPVQKFGWGFAAGVKYANDTFGTAAEVTNYIYQGTFSDVAAGQQLASGMYDDGIDIIFAAAGGVGVGVFNEAKQRASNGEEVFVVGVDVDQYAFGIYDDATQKSVTLTSAQKKIDLAAFNYIDAALNGTFPGGETITLSLADGGVGLPVENPNLTAEVIAKVEEAKKAVLDKTVAVPMTAEEINAYLGKELAPIK